MSPDQVIQQLGAKFGSAIARFEDEIKKLRTGRAHPSMVEDIVVEAYGTPMPLVQLATISTPEPQLIQISPFDPNNLKAIVGTIRDNQTLGMNPMDDGNIIRVSIPPLNEERRLQIAKQLGQKVEEAMISTRNIRHDAIKELDRSKKDKTLGEDDYKRFVKQVDDLVAQTKSSIDSLAKTKETEILTV